MHVCRCLAPTIFCLCWNDAAAVPGSAGRHLKLRWLGLQLEIGREMSEVCVW